VAAEQAAAEEAAEAGAKEGSTEAKEGSTEQTAEAQEGSTEAQESQVNQTGGGEKTTPATATLATQEKGGGEEHKVATPPADAALLDEKTAMQQKTNGRAAERAQHYVSRMRVTKYWPGESTKGHDVTQKRYLELEGNETANSRKVDFDTYGMNTCHETLGQVYLWSASGRPLIPLHEDEAEPVPLSREQLNQKLTHHLGTAFAEYPEHVMHFDHAKGKDYGGFLTVLRISPRCMANGSLQIRWKRRRKKRKFWT
jgi:hypothetical protein